MSAVARKLKIANPTQGVLIPDPGRFMLDKGILFELNRTFFHQMGLALTVQANQDGDMELSLFDHTANPYMTFEPEVFQRGREKWRAFWRETGIKAHHRRRTKLGIINQTMPNYRDQPRIA